MLKTRFLWVILGLGGLLGCMRTFETGVTAYARPDASNLKRFALQGPESGQVCDDPRWPVLAGMLTRALVAKGYVPDAKSPELVIRVTYGVGDTQISIYTYPEPTTPDGTGSSRRVEMSSYTLQIEALDSTSARTRTPLVVWRTHAEMRTNTTDLEDLFPYLVASMEDYFGQTTSETRRVRREMYDPEASRLRHP